MMKPGPRYKYEMTSALHNHAHYNMSSKV
jgi:hypothetical protein